MPGAYDRDLIGYGASPPDPQWPGGARLAVNFVMNYEKGSEPSLQDGEGFSEVRHTEAPDAVVKGRNLAAESMFEYGSRVGFWRLMRLFQARGLPLTIFGCALAIERNPSAAAAIRASGFDVCSHGWRWVNHFELSADEEREHISKAIRSFQATLGERPVGWYCRYGPSVNTRRLIVEEGGFLYDSDYYGDELPFWKTVAGKPHLIVPYSLTNNDGKFIGWTGTADDWIAFVRDAFDMLYREGVIGHPARAAGLERLLDYMMQRRNVWITRRLDIAQHWVATHPYPGKGLNE